MYDFAIVQCDHWKVFFICSAKCSMISINTVIWTPVSFTNA